MELSHEARAVLADVASKLDNAVEKGVVRWVQPDRMHLTLRFLGETAQEKVAEVAATMDAIAARNVPLTLVLDTLGCFPHERQPRVIWVGVGGDVTQVGAIYRELEEGLEKNGWTPESKPFSPHLTIGRVKKRGAKLALPWGKGVAAARTEVREIVLFESRLRPDGPQYIARHVSRLGGG